MINLLLVDDHKIIRDGIKALLSDINGIQIVGECNNGVEVLDKMSKEAVDVILMDINMPKLNGIEATKTVVDKYPKTNVLALTMHNEEIYISKMLKAGASGYVLKDTNKAELVDAINKVNEGENYFNTEVTEIMMSKFLKNPKIKRSIKSNVSVDDLTPREIQVLKLIAEELTNTEAAERLEISPRTIDTHRRNLIQKLGVKNSVGLVKFAIQSGIV